jgi:heptosyltransferase-2
MTPRRLLVRLPNWLGDLLMSRPLLHALRAAFPATHITAIGVEASALLERERLWDEWIRWPEEGRRLPGAREDVALVLPPSFASAWKVPRDIPVRIGFAGEARSWLLTHALPRTARGALHLSEEYLGLGRPLGISSVPLPALEALPSEVEAAAALRGRLGIAETPYAVLAPGAVYGPAKRWPAERFVELGRRFTARNMVVLVCGAASDRAVAAPIAAAIGPLAHGLAGVTTVGEQLALCAAARVTITNDSGVAHLAAATGAATVVLFGSTSSAWTAPLGPRVTVVQHAPVCAPCFQRACRIGYRCLVAIEVDEVERVVREVAA